MSTRSAVPYLRRGDIEQKAEELLAWFDASLLDEHKLIPLAAIALRIGEEFNVNFQFNQPLGISPRGKKILGMCNFSTRTICVDPILIGAHQVRFLFTLAHEIGHLILHRKLKLTEEDLDGAIGSIADNRNHVFLGRRNPRTQRQWLEWQANAFAAALLMPRATVKLAVLEKQVELGINKRRGTIYLDNEPYNIIDYRKILAHLEFIYQTSRTLINIRLRELGILEDHRQLNSPHITSLLRED